MYHIYIETMSSYVRCLVSTGNHRIEIHTPNVMIHNGGKLNWVVQKKLFLFFCMTKT